MNSCCLCSGLSARCEYSVFVADLAYERADLFKLGCLEWAPSGGLACDIGDLALTLLPPNNRNCCAVICDSGEELAKSFPFSEELRYKAIPVSTFTGDAYVSQICSLATSLGS